MRLYYFWNDSHRVLVDDFFLPTLKEHNGHLAVFAVRLPESSTGVVRFGTEEFQRMMVRKAELVSDLISDNDDPFIVSDVDIQFFGSIQPELDLALSAEKDVVFQMEPGGVNTGFMLIRPSKKVLVFWREIAKVLKNTSNRLLNEQALVNQKLRMIEYETFGTRIWSWYMGNMKKDILLHHANCAGNAADKMEQMNKVRRTLQTGLSRGSNR